jgi:hypothetical protein
VLLAKDHVTPDARFKQANFTYPHLIDWFMARHNGYVRSGPLPEDKSWEQFHQVQLGSGATLTVALVRQRQWAWATTSHTWSAQYTLFSRDGFTFAELGGIQWGLGRLQAIMLGTDVEASQTTLASDLEAGSVNVVEAHPPAGHDWSGISPLFNAEEMEMGPFLQRWLELSTSAPMIAAAAAPRAGARVMQGELQDLCNAVEWLYARIEGSEAGDLAPTDQAILDAMTGSGFTSRHRSRVKHLMAQTGKETLEHKLARLAGMLGEESAAWLLGSPNNWAYTVMRLRNSLTHGLLVPGHDDVRLLGDAVLTLKVVLQLALLNHCGYTNALCPVPGEMLRARGQLVRGTRDALIVNHVEDLASRSGQWSERARSLRGAGGGHAGS